MEDYTKFIIVRVGKPELDVCEFGVSEPLNDCTDTTAKKGGNEYLVHAERSGGMFVSGKMKAETPLQDRKPL